MGQKDRTIDTDGCKQVGICICTRATGHILSSGGKTDYKTGHWSEGIELFSEDIKKMGTVVKKYPGAILENVNSGTAKGILKSAAKKNEG